MSGLGLTMSPAISARPAQILRGDFQAFFLAGPRTATGRPRRVIVMGPPRCWISSRRARHLALSDLADPAVRPSHVPPTLVRSSGQRPVQRCQHRFRLMVRRSLKLDSRRLRAGDCRRFDERHHILERRLLVYQKVHAVGGDLQAALVVARRPAPLFQIPQRRTQLYCRRFHHGFDGPHRYPWGGGPGAPAIVEQTKNGRT